MKDKKNILIGALVFVIAVMAVGYAAFATTLNINGNAEIAGEWDVEITGITSKATGTASDKTEPAYTATTATFDAKLMAPGDAMTYTITVENKGTIDAKLSSITFTPQADGSDAIIYTVDSQPSANDVLAAGESTTVVITATYDSSVTSLPDVKTKTITGVLDYVQAD